MYPKYVVVRVTDRDRPVHFDTKVLRLKEEGRGDMRKYGLGIWVLLRDEKFGECLGLSRYPPGSPYGVPYVVGEAPDHIGFVAGDVEATYRELLPRGAESSGVDPAATDGWTAFVKDPHANRVEIFPVTEPQRGKGAP